MRFDQDDIFVDLLLIPGLALFADLHFEGDELAVFVSIKPIRDIFSSESIEYRNFALNGSLGYPPEGAAAFFEREARDHDFHVMVEKPGIVGSLRGEILNCQVEHLKQLLTALRQKVDRLIIVCRVCGFKKAKLGPPAKSAANVGIVLARFPIFQFREKSFEEYRCKSKFHFCNELKHFQVPFGRAEASVDAKRKSVFNDTFERHLTEAARSLFNLTSAAA